MKLNATLKNERNGKKSTSDNTRLLVELCYKNKTLGEIGLYSIRGNGQDLGYRIVWNSNKTNKQVIIEEEEKRQNIKGEIYTEYYCQYCDEVNHDGDDTCKKCKRPMSFYTEN